MNIENIKEALKKPLPGKKAHLQLAPETRIESLLSETPEQIAHAKKAAVLMLFYELNGELTTVFIKRPVYDGVHSGQIALPGGHYEIEDKTLIKTALRETEEEIGVLQKDVTVLGCLSQLYVPPSNFLILPVVGFTNSPPTFVLQADEVADILQVPLSALFNPHNKSSIIVSNKQYGAFNAPCYKIENEIIWGATAMVVNELYSLLAPCCTCFAG